MRGTLAVTLREAAPRNAIAVACQYNGVHLQSSVRAIMEVEVMNLTTRILINPTITGIASRMSHSFVLSVATILILLLAAAHRRLAGQRLGLGSLTLFMKMN